MSEVYFVRHGQASFGSENYDQLSKLGHLQSKLLGEYFSSQGIVFDRIITGDMKRHLQTLDSIKQGLTTKTTQSLPNTEAYAQWNEFDFKQLVNAFVQKFPLHRFSEQTTANEYFSLLKLSLKSWTSGELTENLPENWHEFEQRITDMLNEIKNVNSKKRVLVVSSGGTIGMALRLILQAPPKAMSNLNLQIRNTALSHCYFNASEFELSQFNVLPHLNCVERERHITYI